MTKRKTVGDLIQELSTFPSDMPVLVAGDAEGNDYSFLSVISNGDYVAYTEYDGGLVSEEDLEEKYDDDDEFKPIKVCVIWPI